MIEPTTETLALLEQMPQVWASRYLEVLVIIQERYPRLDQSRQELAAFCGLGLWRGRTLAIPEGETQNIEKDAMIQLIRELGVLPAAEYGNA